jgi:hypothetical protein
MSKADCIRMSASIFTPKAFNRGHVCSILFRPRGITPRNPGPRVTALRILFDKNVPVGVRRFLPKHEVRTVVEMGCRINSKTASF